MARIKKKHKRSQERQEDAKDNDKLRDEITGLEIESEKFDSEDSSFSEDQAKRKLENLK